MGTFTEFVSESRKMRVSFLVLFGVIAVCNTNISAKVVKFVTEDEVNSINQSPAETVQRNHNACQDSVEHIVRKREANLDLARKLDILSRKSGRKKKIESKKNKYEEQKTKTVPVPDKTYSVRKNKYDSETDDKRKARVTPMDDWYLPYSGEKPHDVPIFYSAKTGYNPWNPQNKILPIPQHKMPEFKTLFPEDFLRIGELVHVFRNSFKAGLDSLFDATEAELRKRIIYGTKTPLVFRPPVYNMKMRSSCIDTGDGSCEGESTNDSYDAVSPNECPDDTPIPTNDLNNGIVANTKRSDSPVDFLKEALPAIVKAAESVLGEATDNKKSQVRDFGDDAQRVVADGEIYDRRSFAFDSVDEAADAVADDGISNPRPATYDFGDFDEQNLSLH